MIEAKTGHVDWSEVDVETFARLCEFAYFRNYTPPSFRPIDGKSPSTEVRDPTKEERKRNKRRSNGNLDEPVPEQAPEPELEPMPEPAAEPELEPEAAPEPEASLEAIDPGSRE